jgi:hypothetical protein
MKKKNAAPLLPIIIFCLFIVGYISWCCIKQDSVEVPDYTDQFVNGCMFRVCADGKILEMV